MIVILNIPFVRAAPSSYASTLFSSKQIADEPKPPDDPGLWFYLGTAVALVLLGGAFAGLTIAFVPLQPFQLHWLREFSIG
jgi:metal transporter CNNM